MISCANCEYQLGNHDVFAFMKKKEKWGDSYHFVLKKEFMSVMKDTHFQIDSEVKEGFEAYRVINCKGCLKDVGKMFFGSTRNGPSYEYFAFGKEKLTYEDGTVQLKKVDKWPLVIEKAPFCNFAQVQKHNFYESSPPSNRSWIDDKKRNTESMHASKSSLSERNNVVVPKKFADKPRNISSVPLNNEDEQCNISVIYFYFIFYLFFWLCI